MYLQFRVVHDLLFTTMRFILNELEDEPPKLTGSPAEAVVLHAASTAILKSSVQDLDLSEMVDEGISLSHENEL